jgi:hypothetical protein
LEDRVEGASNRCLPPAFHPDSGADKPAHWIRYEARPQRLLEP